MGPAPELELERHLDRYWGPTRDPVLRDERRYVSLIVHYLHGQHGWSSTLRELEPRFAAPPSLRAFSLFAVLKRAPQGVFDVSPNGRVALRAHFLPALERFC